MAIKFTVTVGSELPSWTFHWTDDDGNTIDFSSGWTFTLRVGDNSTGVLEKTSGITGSDADPNITIDWAVDEWNDVTPGTSYEFTLTPRRTSDGKDREPLRGIVTVKHVIPAPV